MPCVKAIINGAKTKLDMSTIIVIGSTEEKASIIFSGVTAARETKGFHFLRLSQAHDDSDVTN